jgi:uncharacterized protein YdaT
MADASDLVRHAVHGQTRCDLPPRVNEVIERHRQSLLNLANALIAAGRGEDEVVSILQKASESFSMELATNTKGLES